MNRFRGASGLHWPSIRGRARADVGPLVLVAVVVAIAAMLAGAVPPLLRTTADAAARHALRRAGDDAAVQVQAPWADDYGPNGGRVRGDALAQDVDDFGIGAEQELDPALRSQLRAPVTTVDSISLVVTDGSVQRHFQLEYLRSGSAGPAVTWIAGGPPRASVTGFPEIPLNGPPWPVQVGLSEAEAAALKLRPGDHIPLEDEHRTKYLVKVSGVFRPVDGGDPAWQLTPWVLRPVGGLDGSGTTRLGGLLSPDSLPDARLAFLTEQLRRTVRFSADPDKVTWQSAQTLAAAVAALKADSATSGEGADVLQWQTQLDSVLRDVRRQVTVASAQAAVLLIAVLAGTVLILLLAADLLTRRREQTLAAARQRGASLPVIAAELLVESVAVVIPAAAAGLALAWVLAGGADLVWAVPVVVCAVLAGPALGALAAARATRDRRAPANRAARRWADRTRQLRRLAFDAAVPVAAAGALVALRQRGIGSGIGSDAVLPAAAPTLVVIAVALLVARLMPAATRLVLRQTLRSRHPLTVFGAARAATTSGRALPLVILTTTTALASFAVILLTTTGQGLRTGAVQTAGADVRVEVSDRIGPGAAEIAGRIAGTPGVRHVVTGRIMDGVRVTAGDTSATVRLVVVDVAAFRQLPGSAGIPRPAGGGGAVPALIRTSDDSIRPGASLHLLGTNVPTAGLTAAGTAPEVGDAGDVVVIDTAAATAAGMTVTPNTVWVTGPAAARTVRAMAVDGNVVVRAEVLDDRRTAPLVAGLQKLDGTTAGLLLLMGVLGFVLAAAAGAPERWETLARLRTLGLRPRDTRQVAARELLPLLVAAVCGPLLGALVAWCTFGPLTLQVLTRQTSTPRIVLSWWPVAVIVVVLAAALVAVTAAEAALRRRRPLGDMLRAGRG